MWGRLGYGACAPSASCQGTHPHSCAACSPAFCTSSSPRPTLPAVSSCSWKGSEGPWGPQVVPATPWPHRKLTCLHITPPSTTPHSPPPRPSSSALSSKPIPPPSDSLLSSHLSSYLDLLLVTQPSLFCLCSKPLHMQFLLPGSRSPGFSNQHLSAGWNNAHSPWQREEIPPPPAGFPLSYGNFFYQMFSFSKVVNACKEQKDYTEVYIKSENHFPWSHPPEITMVHNTFQTFSCEFTTFSFFKIQSEIVLYVLFCNFAPLIVDQICPMTCPHGDNLFACILSLSSWVISMFIINSTMISRLAHRSWHTCERVWIGQTPKTEIAWPQSVHLMDQSCLANSASTFPNASLYLSPPHAHKLWAWYRGGPQGGFDG